MKLLVRRRLMMNSNIQYLRNREKIKLGRLAAVNAIYQTKCFYRNVKVICFITHNLYIRDIPVGYSYVKLKMIG